MNSKFLGGGGLCSGVFCFTATSAESNHLVFFTKAPQLSVLFL